MFEIRDNPEFSWSFSRDNIFNKCKKQYYYTYYASHNGWLPKEETTEEKIIAYRYKNVTNLQIAFGSNTHDLIKNFIKYPSSQDVFLPTLKDKMHESCLKGQNIDAWKHSPKNNNIMMEILYWGGWNSKKSKEQINAIKNKMNNINNLFKTKTMLNIFENNYSKIIEVDENLNLNKFSRVIIDDITAFAKIDLLYIDKNNKWNIVDWKTNNVDFNYENNQNQIMQLYLYAYYVHQKYNIDYKDIICKFENVITGNDFIINSISDSDIALIEKRIKRSIEDMSEYVENNNLKDNKSKNIALFNGIYDEDNKECSSCKFKALCGGC